MYECDCHIGCLSGRITRVGSDGGENFGLSGSVTRVGSAREETFGLSGGISRVGSDITGYVSLVCSVNKEGRFWMWDAGKKLLWDNNIEIDF